MDLSAMPSPVKGQLLEQLRSQLGDDRYRDLVDRFGEDGLIGIALEAASSPRVSQPKASVWKRAWDARLFEVVGFVCTPLWLLLMGSINSWRQAAWLALNFVCFGVFAIVVRTITGTSAVEDWLWQGFAVGLCITIPTYLLCVVVLWIEDLSIRA